MEKKSKRIKKNREKVKGYSHGKYASILIADHRVCLLVHDDPPRSEMKRVRMLGES